MSDHPGGRIDEMTWPAAAEAFSAGLPLLAPIGAAAKAHGAHLPLGTDWIAVEAIADRVAARRPALIAPTVGFGYYPAFVEFPASLHLPADLFEGILVAALSRYVESGARKIVILNNGVSTEGPVVVAAHSVYAATGVRPAIAQLRRFGREADHILDAPDGGHADERETSVMLALRPDLVDMSRAAAAPPNPAPSGPAHSGPALARPVRLAHNRAPAAGEASAAGALGDARRATAAKGEQILEAIVDDLVAAIDRIFPESPEQST